MLSFDEWNVWYRTRRPLRVPRAAGLAGRAADPGGSLLDARMRWRSAASCISLLNHADRVRCACLAQLVNVIAPIMTRDRRSGLAADDLLSLRPD